MSEAREWVINELKALLDRLRSEGERGDHLVALERAIGWATADEFTQGALSRLGGDIIHVKRVRGSRRNRLVGQPERQWRDDDADEELEG